MKIDSTLPKLPAFAIDRSALAAFNSKLIAYADDLDRVLPIFEITTPLRICHFLGQMAHESQGFVKLEENMNYSAERLMAVFNNKKITRFPDLEFAKRFARQPEKIASYVYANRNGNGNVESGDGWLYRGSGWTHLTFRSNFRAATVGLRKVMSGVPDFETRPDAARTPVWAPAVAAWFWKEHGCNEAADRDDAHAVTARINGGDNGLEDRITKTDAAKAAFGI